MKVINKYKLDTNEIQRIVDTQHIGKAYDTRQISDTVMNIVKDRFKNRLYDKVSNQLKTVAEGEYQQTVWLFDEFEINNIIRIINKYKDTPIPLTERLKLINLITE